MNLLSARGVQIVKPIFNKRSVCFYIYGKDMKAVSEILKKVGREFEITCEKGAMPYLQALIRRIGLVAGVVVVIVGIIVYSTALFSYKVYGNKTISEERILESLPYIEPLPKLFVEPDIEKIEKSVLNIEGISSVDVKRRGRNIEIKVLEEIPRTEVIERIKGIPVCSAFEAEITRVVCLDGTAKVKRGDRVQKGDVLISPYYDFGDGLTADSSANGEIYGLVDFSKSFEIPSTKTDYVRTNVGEIKYGMEWCGRKIVTANTGFTFFDVEEEVFFVEAAVPLKITKYTFFEKKAVEVEFDFERYEEGIVKESFIELEMQLPTDAKINKKWYSVKRLDNATYLDVYYQIEILING